MKREKLEKILKKIKMALLEVDENGIPKIHPLSTRDNLIDLCRKYVINNDKAKAVYKRDNIMVFINKKDGSIFEGLLIKKKDCGFTTTELYNLETEKLIFYYDGFDTTFNADYYHYLFNEFYPVNFQSISDYLGYQDNNEWFSLEQIREYEPIIIDGLNKIKEVKEQKKTIKRA